MIIGLTGFIGSGKGTVGDILVSEHGYQKFAFADALKDAVSIIFQWDRSLLEGDTDESRIFRELRDDWWSRQFGYDVTPRLILQTMGTEACRRGIADNIWIAALEKRIAGHHRVIISDVRFPNEIKFVRSVGGKVVRVKRGEDPTPDQLATMHISETAWNDIAPDMVIENNGSLEDLKANVSKLLTHYENTYTIFHHPV